MHRLAAQLELRTCVRKMHVRRLLSRSSSCSVDNLSQALSDGAQLYLSTIFRYDVISRCQLVPLVWYVTGPVRMICVHRLYVRCEYVL